MADETKRVIDQTTDTSLSAGDYVIVDSESEGTRKFDLGTELTDIKQDLDNLESVPASVRQAIYACLEDILYMSNNHADEKSVIYEWAYPTITGITVAPTTLTFNTISNQTLTATLLPTGASGTIIWTSSNEAVATVSNGIVTSVGNGTCTITASCGSHSASCAVTCANIPVTYSVTNTLTGCTTSNSYTRVEENSSYSAVISPEVGYVDTWASATVTMGGNDITSTAWDNGTITIPTVTGAIVITVTATADTRTLLHNWDFTQSLIDTVANKEMILSNSNSGTDLPTRDSSGLHFNAAEEVAYAEGLTEFTTLGTEWELDVASAEFAGTETGATNHKRLLIADRVGQSYNRGVMIFKGSAPLQTWFNGSWKTYTAESGQTIPATTDPLSGKTVKVAVNSEGIVSLYLDGILTGKTSSSVTNERFPYNSILIGGNKSGTQAAGNQIYNMVITGLRIYKEA